MTIIKIFKHLNLFIEVGLDVFLLEMILFTEISRVKMILREGNIFIMVISLYKRSNGK